MTEDDIKSALKRHTVSTMSETTSNLILKAVNDYLEMGASDVADALLQLSLGYMVPTSVAYKHIVHNGGEGEGDHADGVFQLEDTFFDFSYSYQSYDGFQPEYGTLCVVQPIQKQITVYEAI